MSTSIEDLYRELKSRPAVAARLVADGRATSKSKALARIRARADAEPRAWCALMREAAVCRRPDPGDDHREKAYCYNCPVRTVARREAQARWWDSVRGSEYDSLPLRFDLALSELIEHATEVDLRWIETVTLDGAGANSSIYLAVGVTPEVLRRIGIICLFASPHEPQPDGTVGRWGDLFGGAGVDLLQARVGRVFVAGFSEARLDPPFVRLHLAACLLGPHHWELLPWPPAPADWRR